MAFPIIIIIGLCLYQIFTDTQIVFEYWILKYLNQFWFPSLIFFYFYYIIQYPFISECLYLAKKVISYFQLPFKFPVKIVKPNNIKAYFCQNTNLVDILSVRGHSKNIAVLFS